MLKDILLDADGDIDLSSGDIQFTSGLQAVAQGIRIRLLSFKGEWFADLENGMDDYRQGVYDEAKVTADVRVALLSVPGVTRIVALSVSLEPSTRILSVDWNVTALDTNLEGST